MKDRNQIILAFIIGAAAGAVAGLLFTPYKGSVFRRKLSDVSSHLTEDLMHKAEKGFSAIQDLTEKFHSKKIYKN
jgi:gas vesicle protein